MHHLARTLQIASRPTAVSAALPALLRTLLSAALAALSAVLLGACATLPPRGGVEPSQAWPAADTARTTLARIAADSLPPGADAPTPPSGFQLLLTGEFAFGARIALARRAEQSLDL